MFARASRTLRSVSAAVAGARRLCTAGRDTCLARWPPYSPERLPVAVTAPGFRDGAFQAVCRASAMSRFVHGSDQTNSSSPIARAASRKAPRELLGPRFRTGSADDRIQPWFSPPSPEGSLTSSEIGAEDSLAYPAVPRRVRSRRRCAQGPRSRGDTRTRSVVPSRGTSPPARAPVHPLLQSSV